jgi:O-antigen/teichoic acid export membrane protein
MSFARQSLGSLAALAFGVAVSIVLPRILGAEARGEYQLAVRLAGLVLAVAQWGIPEVLLQVVAERRQALGALVGTSLGLGLAGAAIVAGLLGIAAPLFRDTLLRGVDPLLLWITLAGSLVPLTGLLARRFIQIGAGGRLDVYNGLDVARTALFLALAITAGALLPRQAIGATAAWLVAELGLALAALAFVSRRLAARQSWRLSRSLATDLVRSGAPIQVGLLAMFLGNEGGAYVLNARLDLATVGLYSVALSLARFVLQVSVALRTALQPRLMGSEADSAGVTARVTRHGLVWMLLVAVGLAVGSPLVPVVLTREFAGAAPALVLLLPGMVAYGVWQLVAGHLLRIGRRGLLAANSWLFAGVAMVLQALGADALGLVGAAAGLSLAYVLAAGVATLAFLRLSGRSARELVPAPADLAFYVRLGRSVLAPS